MLNYCLYPGSNFKWNVNQNTSNRKTVVQNVVCKMTAIFFWAPLRWIHKPRCCAPVQRNTKCFSTQLTRSPEISRHGIGVCTFGWITMPLKYIIYYSITPFLYFKSCRLIMNDILKQYEKYYLLATPFFSFFPLSFGALLWNIAQWNENVIVQTQFVLTYCGWDKWPPFCRRHFDNLLLGISSTWLLHADLPHGTCILKLAIFREMLSVILNNRRKHNPY